MNILIYKKNSELKPTGGPNGYLYNLKKGLDIIGINCIEFLPKEEQNIKQVNTNKKSIILKKIKSIKILKQVYKLTILKLRNLIENKRWVKEIEEKYIKNNIKTEIKDFNKYDYIHFHSTFELYNEKENLKNYNGKIILTSHSPKPAYLEYIDSLRARNVKKIEKYYELEKVDEYAFNRADYIIFPCEEAEEPYYNQWDKYKKIKEKNNEKYKYILTGIPKCVSKISKEDIRKQYNIPQDAFLISYVGRHNEVKGYDILKRIGQEVFKNNENIYIIVAGQEGPLYRLENKKWIEVGWTDDPHSIIAASDLFVLPNRETYFDLILLEVLSLGVPMLVSYTGGNKYFYKNYKDSGISYFSTFEQAINEVLKLSKLDRTLLKSLGEKNRKIYENDFNEKVFAKKYLETIENIEKNN